MADPPGLLMEMVINYHALQSNHAMSLDVQERGYARHESLKFSPSSNADCLMPWQAGCISLGPVILKMIEARKDEYLSMMFAFPISNQGVELRKHGEIPITLPHQSV